MLVNWADTTRERREIRKRVTLRKTWRMKGLVGLLILLKRLTKLIRNLSLQEVQEDKEKRFSFKFNGDSESNKQMTRMMSTLSERRKNIQKRSHGTKTKLRNFSLALSAFMASKKRAQLKKRKRRNASIFQRSCDRNLLNYQIWVMRRNGDLSSENLLGWPKDLGPEGFEEKELNLQSLFGNYKVKHGPSRVEDIRVTKNSLTRTRFVLGIDGMGLVNFYQSHFINLIDKLLTIPDLQKSEESFSYYNMIRLEKSRTVDNHILECYNNDQSNSKKFTKKCKSFQEDNRKRIPEVPMFEVGFESLITESRGILNAVDCCLKKIYKDLAREKNVQFNYSKVEFQMGDQTIS